MDEQEREHAEGPSSPDIVRLGLIFYGVMLAVALVWRMGFYDESVLFASADAEAAGVRWGRDLGLGLLVGLLTVGASSLLTRLTDWGDALARGLGRAIGRIEPGDALLLAFASGLAEEAFFRGALQPRVGLVLASLIFGCVHFIPQRALLPWTGFAVVMGLALGGLFEWTGNLVAPVVAHTVINGINLPLLSRRYGQDESTGD